MSFSCAVCYRELPEAERLLMPCCGTTTSTVQFCRHCLHLICTHGVQSYIGRCPSCSVYFSMPDQHTVQLMASIPMQCRMCLQMKDITDPSRQLCSACMLGSEFAFHYECNRCHRLQMIPHPMWLYQPSPTEYGTASWACHGGCDDYTFWRIRPEDLHRVPADHTPESWGLRGDWLGRIRGLRQEQIGAGAGSGSGAGDDGDGAVRDRRVNEGRTNCALS
jgi:hypothetical protein